MSTLDFEIVHRYNDGGKTFMRGLLGGSEELLTITSWTINRNIENYEKIHDEEYLVVEVPDGYVPKNFSDVNIIRVYGKTSEIEIEVFEIPYVDEWTAYEFRTNKSLLTEGTDDSNTPGPFMSLGIRSSGSNFVMFQSGGSHCGMFVNDEAFEKIQECPTIEVVSVGYFAQFTSKNVLGIRTKNGYIINVSENPLESIFKNVE